MRYPGFRLGPIWYPGFRYSGVMARTKTPDGKRVGISAKFSEPEAAEIDAARGGMQRGPWLRLAALAAARDGQPGNRGPAVRADSPDPGYVRWAPSGPVYADDAPAPDCRHPSGSVEDNVCRDCGNEVDLR